MDKRRNTKRKICTTVNGVSFCQETKDFVWNKADKIRGKNSDEFRKDKYGNIIEYSKYNTHDDRGWHIDHSKPVSKDGTDHPNNLQALQWYENEIKSNHYPYPQTKRDRLMNKKQ